MHNEENSVNDLAEDAQNFTDHKDVKDVRAPSHEYSAEKDDIEPATGA